MPDEGVGATGAEGTGRKPDEGVAGSDLVGVAGIIPYEDVAGCGCIIVACPVSDECIIVGCGKAILAIAGLITYESVVDTC